MPIETVDIPAYGLSGPRRVPKQELGKNDFLLLLTQQLQNQDPLSPMENTEFISQMANFSTLEQITNLTTSIEKVLAKGDNAYKTEAIGLLGKEIVAQRADMGEPLGGPVTSVRFEEGQAFFTVQDKEFTLDNLLYVQNSDPQQA